MTNLTPDEQLAALEAEVARTEALRSEQVALLIAEVERLRLLAAEHSYKMPSHEGPQAASHADAIRAFNECQADLTALAARVNALLIDPHHEVPPDGTMWLATYTGGWQPDRPPREKIWHRSDLDHNGFPDGDWWQIGDDDEHRYQWGEVICLDDPPEDRASVTLEQLLTADEIERALTGSTPP